MSSAEPPQHPDKVTIALFGKKAAFVRRIDNIILKGTNAAVTKLSNFVERENASYRIISTAEFFEERRHPEELIIDFMALSDPGPHLFILAVDSDHSQEENVQAQITKVKDVFGGSVINCVAVILENQESLNLLEHVRKTLNIRMKTLDENLAAECKKWCSHQTPFQFDYNKYTQDAVERRKKDLKHTRNTNVPPDNPGSKGARNQSPSSSEQTAPPAEGAPGQDNGASNQSPFSPEQTAPPPKKTPVQDKGGRGAGAKEDGVFSIILLGQTGTGKSASANTILAAGKHRQPKGQVFESKLSSMPVTTKCKEKITAITGTKVRVVDTPDFFYEDAPADEAQVEECKKYCQEGRCVVLLVIQLGRFTQGEKGILEKLEDKLGWEIRKNTIVLFTHGEDLTGTVEAFIGVAKPQHHPQSSEELVVSPCSPRVSCANLSPDPEGPTPPEPKPVGPSLPVHQSLSEFGGSALPESEGLCIH
ncbi:uncharacterized protein LOC115789772 [Archocentrus centrarchus]|uniref:uncharacterized protein LOC115789772 n=1 Tax=Archocentrus centrarchus TaxID=63155 RepID=UPI0011E9F702|nr:uncharacterized protein LOC115789772 [Archocentrus centrarchus]